MSKKSFQLNISGISTCLGADKGKLKCDVKALKARLTLVLTYMCTEPIQLSIKFCNEQEMQILNLNFRGKESATDVLSFPPFRMNDNFQTESSIHCLGDVAICVPVCQKQALSRKIPLIQEIEKMLCHGIVHLKGFDHERNDASHRVMSALERAVRAELKISTVGENWMTLQEKKS